MTSLPNVEVVIWGPTRLDRWLSGWRAILRTALNRWLAERLAAGDFPPEAAALGEPDANRLLAELLEAHIHNRKGDNLADYLASPAAMLELMRASPAHAYPIPAIEPLERLLGRWCGLLASVPDAGALVRDYADKDALRAL